jgi:hypothetical protein
MENQPPQAEPNKEHLEIIESRKILDVKWSNLDDSKFREFCMNNASIHDVCATGVKITDANLATWRLKMHSLAAPISIT